MRCLIKMIGDIRQEGLDISGSIRARVQSFLNLRKKVIDETMQVLGVFATSVNRGFCKNEEWRMPPGAPRG